MSTSQLSALQSKGEHQTGHTSDHIPPCRPCHTSLSPLGVLPGGVAAVGEGHVAGAQAVEGAQDAQAAVDGVAALHPDEAGHLPVLERLPDT